jgi:hypothetical protein
VPFILHQFLIQWDGDEIESVHTDSSAFALGHNASTCLSGHDLTDFQFMSVTREGIVPISLKSIDNRLNNIM